MIEADVEPHQHLPARATYRSAQWQHAIQIDQHNPRIVLTGRIPLHDNIRRLEITVAKTSLQKLLHHYDQPVHDARLHPDLPVQRHVAHGDGEQRVEVVGVLDTLGDQDAVEHDTESTAFE